MSIINELINSDLLKTGNQSSGLLIIDNNSYIQSDLKKIVENLCCPLYTAQDGNSGLHLIEKHTPDIIFLNLDLPDMEGIELLSKFKGNRDIISRFVVIENPGDHLSLDDIIRWGIRDYIELPYTFQKLELRVKNILLLKTCEEIARGECADIKVEKQKIENERNLLKKYFSKDLVEGILNGNISTDLGGEIKIASILFCDLRNSTGIAENIEPDMFWDFLNNLFTDITDIVYGEKGSVNKFLGDGILATFGCPKSLEDDAMHCARVAIKIRKYLHNFNQFRPKYLAKPIEMGVGVARGKLFIGNIGSVNQIEYTVLGDPVNTASRLESLTKYGNVDILIDGNTCDELGDRAEATRIKLSGIKGKINEVEVFYLKDLKDM